MMAVVLPDSPRPRCVSKREWDIQRKEDLAFTICDIMHTDLEIPAELVDEYNDLVFAQSLEEKHQTNSNNVKREEIIFNEETENRVNDLVEKAFKGLKELFCKE